MSLDTQMTADVSAIFAGDFVTAATHVRGPVNEVLNVLFDRPHSTAGDDDMERSPEDPQIRVQTSDMENVEPDSQFTIEGTVFTIIEIMPDEHGVTKILLSED